MEEKNFIPNKNGGGGKDNLLENYLKKVCVHYRTKEDISQMIKEKYPSLDLDFQYKPRSKNQVIIKLKNGSGSILAKVKTLIPR